MESLYLNFGRWQLVKMYQEVLRGALNPRNPQNKGNPQLSLKPSSLLSSARRGGNSPQGRRMSAVQLCCCHCITVIHSERGGF